MTILQTNRLRLRDYIPDDLSDLHRLLSDTKTMYFLDELQTTTIEETAQNLTMACRNADGHYFCIRHSETDAFVGSIGYTITTRTPLGNVAHLGYFLLPNFHGKGYAAEAARKVLEFAFRHDGCIRMTTACYAANVPSRKVMEKAGFRKEGTRIQSQYHDGCMKDRLEYALNKKEYLRGNADENHTNSGL